MGDLLGKMTEEDFSKMIEEANKNSLVFKLIELLRDHKHRRLLKAH
jgi:hypothetical protein